MSSTRRRRRVFIAPSMGRVGPKSPGSLTLLSLKKALVAVWSSNFLVPLAMLCGHTKYFPMMTLSLSDSVMLQKGSWDSTRGSMTLRRSSVGKEGCASRRIAPAITSSSSACLRALNFRTNLRALRHFLCLERSLVSKMSSCCCVSSRLRSSWVALESMKV